MKKLTDEQQACVSAAVMGKNLKIKAFDEIIKNQSHGS